VVIGKRTLVEEVWPSTFVDESNLRFQMACLRKALGSERDIIRTVPGRGYVFTGDCHRVAFASEPPQTPLLATARGTGGSGLPAQLFHLSSDPATTKAGYEGHPHGIWHLASLSLARGPLPTSAPAVGDVASQAPQHLVDHGPAHIEVLLPMLVLSDFSHSGTVNCVLPPATMEPLLAMIGAALDRGFHVQGSSGAAA
jgi:hypothetical protein